MNNDRFTNERHLTPLILIFFATTIICACCVISADQHATKATVFLDNRMVENARLDRRLFSNDIQVSESSGTVYVVSGASIAYTSYQGPAWHFGPLALSAILIVLLCAMGGIGYFVFEMTNDGGVMAKRPGVRSRRSCGKDRKSLMTTCRPAKIPEGAIKKSE